MHCECRRPDGGTTEEAKLQGNRVGLILSGEGGAEVYVCDSEDARCDVAALRD